MALVQLPLAVVHYNPPLFVLGAGVVIALGGHITQFRRVVAVGIALIFLGTVLAFYTAYRDYQQQGSPPSPAPTNPYEGPRTR